jgi:Fe2+ or Zn2+ uptake regulation protein
LSDEKSLEERVYDALPRRDKGVSVPIAELMKQGADPVPLATRLGESTQQVKKALRTLHEARSAEMFQDDETHTTRWFRTDVPYKGAAERAVSVLHLAGKRGKSSFPSRMAVLSAFDGRETERQIATKLHGEFSLATVNQNLAKLVAAGMVGVAQQAGTGRFCEACGQPIRATLYYLTPEGEKAVRQWTQFKDVAERIAS